MNREKQLLHQLRRLRVEYQERAQPIIAELAKIQATKIPGPYVIDLMRLHPATENMRLSIEHTMRRFVDLAGGKPETETAASEEER